MPRLLLLLVTLLFISCEQEWTSAAPRHKKYFATMPEPEKPPRWLDFEYDKATVHVIVDEFGRGLMDGTLSGKMITRELNHFEIVQLDELLSSDMQDSLRRPSCFWARHAVLFWNNDQIVARVKICFQCGTTEIWPHVKHYHDGNYRRLFASYGYPARHDHAEYYGKLYKKLHPER